VVRLVESMTSRLGGLISLLLPVPQFPDLRCGEYRATSMRGQPVTVYQVHVQVIALAPARIEEGGVCVCVCVCVCVNSLKRFQSWAHGALSPVGLECQATGV
jgi:hypothetical protein